MRKNLVKITFIFISILLLISHVTSALEINRQALESGTDLRAGKDHPMVSRIPNSWIVQYESKEFDQMDVLLGKSLGQDQFEKTQPLEGKVTRIGYALPEDRSSFEALRQYEAALKSSGFQPIYSCDGSKCGPLFDQSFEKLPGEDDDFYYYDMEVDTLHYSASKLSRPEGDVFVALITFSPNEVRGLKNAFALIRIAELKSMEKGLVTVDSAAMQKGIQAEGHMAIYGITFDFNKADIKPESKPTLTEIANLLKQNPNLKLHVVGHTDNIGTYDYNLDLSSRRAQAVVRSLSSEYGIQLQRLHPAGVGPVAPVALNDSEEGRSKNRRVELVKQ